MIRIPFREFETIQKELQRLDSLPKRDVAALMAPLAVPGAKVVLSSAPSLSYLGGVPRLPESCPWPTVDGCELDFIGRLSLSMLNRVAPIDWLPKTGALLFFYYVPGGYELGPPENRAWAVLHVPDLAEPLEDGQPEVSPGLRLPHRNVEFRRINSYPSPERPTVKALELEGREWESYFEICDEMFGSDPKHQIGGFPSPVLSDDMEPRVQLYSHGHSSCAEVREGAKNWRLLFQFDLYSSFGDESEGLSKDDKAFAYFWIEEAAARVANFENVWFSFQETVAAVGLVSAQTGQTLKTYEDVPSMSWPLQR